MQPRKCSPFIHCSMRHHHRVNHLRVIEEQSEASKQASKDSYKLIIPHYVRYFDVIECSLVK